MGEYDESSWHEKRTNIFAVLKGSTLNLLLLLAGFLLLSLGTLVYSLLTADSYFSCFVG